MTPTHKPQTCTECGQLVKIYGRSIYKKLALQLVSLVEEWEAGRGDGDGYVHLRATIQSKQTGGGDFAKLRLWAPPLIEQKINDDTAKRASGMWRPTQAGVDFVRGRLRVPTHIFLYNDTVLSVSSELGSINDALGEAFHYGEMMATEAAQ